MDKSAYEARLKEFGDEFISDPLLDLSQLINASGEWLESLTGEPEAVRQTMLRLLDALESPEKLPQDDRDWRREWDGPGLSTAQIMRRGQGVTSLIAFGDYGLNPDIQLSGPDREAAIGATIADFRAFLDKVPQGWTSLKEMERVLLACEARYRIDTGLPVSAEQLAAISGLALRSVRNLMTPLGSRDSGLQPDADGLVPADLAAAWLAQRPDFKSSLWREFLEPDENEPLDDDLHSDGDSSQEWLFVPVAADGTSFTPELRRGDVYIVGAKGQEQQFSDYREALGFLASSNRPSWRRPSPNGNWGIVRARDWQRRSARSLGLLP